jgi:hypothetical protein
MARRDGELIGKNEADKRIFRLAAQDESRHVAFGVMHLKQMIEHDPRRKDEVVGHIRSQFPGAGRGGRAQPGNVTIASGPAPARPSPSSSAAARPTSTKATRS